MSRYFYLIDNNLFESVKGGQGFNSSPFGNVSLAGMYDSQLHMRKKFNFKL